jgi:hypothetical protein
MSGAQSVFAVQSDGTDAAFDRIIIELDAALFEGQAQNLAMYCRASPVGNLAETWARLWARQASISSSKPMARNGTWWWPSW